MSEMPTVLKRRLYLPAYSVSDAARYAKITPHTVGYWHHRGGTLGPALPGRERRQRLSYLQLIEVGFVAEFRRAGVPLQRIRKARDYFAQHFKVEYPFAELRLKTEGHHVLLEMLEIDPDPALKGLVIVGDKDGQSAWTEVIAEKFKEFTYEGELAIQWRVGGIDSSVFIDPRVVFGAPSMRGIPTWALRGRANAGESIEEIAADFGLSEQEVAEALDFEGVQLAA